ncbi:MAG: hypothetical protein DRP08_00315 [Candidatus Aenigmatarchaeota archaeon]|nr:MAG: hypothetical protein DRP08_00315 [Candidatus Aenigmarchaeota archaeon]
MKKSKNIIRLIIFVISLSLLLFLSEFFNIEQEPEVLVKNLSIEQRDGIFFKNIVYRYPAEVNVIKLLDESKINIGVSSDTDKFNFGRLVFNVTPASSKFLSIPNNDKRAAKINIKSYGNISPFITVDKNNIIVEPGTKGEITVKLNASRLGRYVGEVDIFIKLPKYDFLVPLIYVS